MCKLCDEVDKVINEIEATRSPDHWRKVVLAVIEEIDEPMTEEDLHMIKNDTTNLWMNIICHVAARWACRHQIPVMLLLHTIALKVYAEYQNQHNTAVEDTKTPQGPQVH